MKIKTIAISLLGAGLALSLAACTKTVPTESKTSVVPESEKESAPAESVESSVTPEPSKSEPVESESTPEVVKFKVTLMDGSTVADTVEVEPGKKLSYISAPPKDGYDYKGAYKDAEFKEEYDFAPVNADTIIYLKYEAKATEYTVTIMDGTAVFSTVKAKAGTSIEVTNTNKTGYTFDGIYTDAALTKKYNGEGITGDTTLYLKYTANPVEVTKYTVTIYDGSTVVNTVQVESGKALSFEAPEKTGYTFDGIYTDATFTTKYEGAAITAATNVYLKYIEDKIEDTDPEMYKKLVAKGGVIYNTNFSNNPTITTSTDGSLSVSKGLYSYAKKKATDSVLVDGNNVVTVADGKATLVDKDDNGTQLIVAFGEHKTGVIEGYVELSLSSPGAKWTFMQFNGISTVKTAAGEVFGLRTTDTGTNVGYRLDGGTTTNGLNAISYSSNQLNIYYMFDLDSQTVTIMINGEYLLNEFALTTNIQSLNGFKLASSDGGSKTMSVDNLVVRNEKLSVDEYKAQYKKLLEETYASYDVATKYPSAKGTCDTIYNNGLANIDAATTKAAMKTAYDNAIKDIDSAIITLEKKSLCDELEAYPVMANYTTNKSLVETAVANGKSNINAATTIAAARDALATAKAAIDAIKTDAQLQADFLKYRTEQDKAYNDYVAALMLKYTDATLTSTLDGYKNDGSTAISNAADKTAVDTAYAEWKKKADDAVTAWKQANNALEIYTSSGEMESAYIEWEILSSVETYDVYYKLSTAADTAYKKIDTQLIRKYSDKVRADVVGLAPGTYTLKIDADGVTATENVVVTSYDRTGFAFSNSGKLNPATEGIGAYNNDGTLKTGAKVLYVSSKTAKTVTMDVAQDTKGGKTTFTGLQAIITAYQKGCETTPLAVRIIGRLTDTDMDSLDSSEEGLQIKGKAAGSKMPITIEGIGNDATIDGFGLLVRNCAGIEIRNLGFMTDMDDDVSLDTGNYNLWVHDNDFFYGPNGSGDHAKGDGALDIKGTEYATLSYNHFWDTGKTTLNSNGDWVNYVSYHHNWYDHSDSRHPRIRKSEAIHVYNNYYDGISKYGVGSTTGSSAFVENNYFRNCKFPMLSSMQGSDIYAGTTTSSNDNATFSKEEGGVIKSFGNYMEGNYTYIPYNATTYICKGTSTAYNLSGTTSTVNFDAYEASTRNEQVPSTVTALLGGTSYSNFDTDSSIMYTYTVQTPADAKDTVTKYAGRVQGGDLKWTFDNATEDTNYSVIPGLRSAIDNYKGPSITIQGIGESGGGGSTDPVDPTPTTTTVEDVIAAITALPESTAVTAADVKAINAAKALYDKLSATDQALVSNYSKLSACLTAVAALPVAAKTITFTANNTASDSSVTGTWNIRTGEAEKTYDGTSLGTTVAKVESATSIAVTVTGACTIKVITNQTAAGKRIYVDGTDYSTDASGVITITVTAGGTYTLTKHDSFYIYAIVIE